MVARFTLACCVAFLIVSLTASSTVKAVDPCTGIHAECGEFVCQGTPGGVAIQFDEKCSQANPWIIRYECLKVYTREQAPQGPGVKEYIAAERIQCGQGAQAETTTACGDLWGSDEPGDCHVMLIGGCGGPASNKACTAN